MLFLTNKNSAKSLSNPGFWGMIQNPQDEQKPKLSLELNYEQEVIEKNEKTSASNERAGTVLNYNV